MIISADVRPRNLKRGVSMKKFCQALGFDDVVGLHDIVGKIEFSGEAPKEYAFLRALYEAFCPLHNQSSKISIEINGKLLMSYSQPGASLDAGPCPEKEGK